MTKFVNLTPHMINVHQPDGVTRTQAEPLDGIPTYIVETGEITGLPEPEAGVVYIVSGYVSGKVQRKDVVAPGELVRDEDGRPIGCLGLTRAVL
jgi:hypothetical protein